MLYPTPFPLSVIFAWQNPIPLSIQFFAYTMPVPTQSTAVKEKHPNANYSLSSWPPTSSEF